MNLKQFFKPRKRGFTLSEVLVVIIVIAILAAVATPIYNRAIKRSRASDALKVLSVASAKQESFLLSNDRFARSFTELRAPIKGLVGNPTDRVELGAFAYIMQPACIVANRPQDDITIFRNFVTNQEGCMGDGCVHLQNLIPTMDSVGCIIPPPPGGDDDGGRGTDPCIENPELCKCPAGYFEYNGRCCECKPDEKKNCGTGKTRTCRAGCTWGPCECDNLNTDQPKCIEAPSLGKWSNDTCSCICQDEKILQNGVCVCPAHRPKWNPTKKKCDCANIIDCHDGFWNDKECFCQCDDRKRNKCYEGEGEWNDKDCTCTCKNPRKKFDADGRCACEEKDRTACFKNGGIFAEDCGCDCPPGMEKEYFMSDDDRMCVENYKRCVEMGGTNCKPCTAEDGTQGNMSFRCVCSQASRDNCDGGIVSPVDCSCSCPPGQLKFLWANKVTYGCECANDCRRAFSACDPTTGTWLPGYNRDNYNTHPGGSKNWSQKYCEQYPGDCALVPGYPEWGPQAPPNAADRNSDRCYNTGGSWFSEKSSPSCYCKCPSGTTFIDSGKFYGSCRCDNAECVGSVCIHANNADYPEAPGTFEGGCVCKCAAPRVLRELQLGPGAAPCVTGGRCVLCENDYDEDLKVMGKRRIPCESENRGSWNTSTCKCDCLNGLVEDPHTGMCVCENFKHEYINGQCVCPEIEVCPARAKWNPTTCECDCPTGEKDFGDGVCRKCPVGQIDVAGTCRCANDCCRNCLSGGSSTEGCDPVAGIFRGPDSINYTGWFMTDPGDRKNSTRCGSSGGDWSGPAAPPVRRCDCDCEGPSGGKKEWASDGYCKCKNLAAVTAACEEAFPGTNGKYDKDDCECKCPAPRQWVGINVGPMVQALKCVCPNDVHTVLGQTTIGKLSAPCNAKPNRTWSNATCECLCPDGTAEDAYGNCSGSVAALVQRPALRSCNDAASTIMGNNGFCNSVTTTMCANNDYGRTGAVSSSFSTRCDSRNNIVTLDFRIRPANDSYWAYAAIRQPQVGTCSNCNNPMKMGFGVDNLDNGIKDIGLGCTGLKSSGDFFTIARCLENCKFKAQNVSCGGGAYKQVEADTGTHLTGTGTALGGDWTCASAGSMPPLCSSVGGLPGNFDSLSYNQKCEALLTKLAAGGARKPYECVINHPTTHLFNTYQITTCSQKDSFYGNGVCIKNSDGSFGSCGGGLNSGYCATGSSAGTRIYYMCAAEGAKTTHKNNKKATVDVLTCAPI